MSYRFIALIAASLLCAPAATQADAPAAPQSVTQEQNFTVIDFWSPSCPPCRRFLPVFDQVAQEMSGLLTFQKINMATDGNAGGQYGVRSIPTVILLQNGREVQRQVGYMDAATFKSWLTRAMQR